MAYIDDVMMVLSGMSTIDQLNDNVSYRNDFQPLNSDEINTIKKAQDIMRASDSIACTACHYCTPGCPQQIPIPEIFEAMNCKLLFHDDEAALKRYQQKTNGKSKAKDCIAGGQCEFACPQHLTIIEYLKRAPATFD